MFPPLGFSDSLAAAADPLDGLPYRALRQLGAGGMGEVYLAEHRELGRLCVAKILHAYLAGDPILADRIRIEAESLGRLNHPHIVSIIGAGQTLDERPFIIMEYLRGRSLADELAARGRLPVIEALGYTCQLLQALAAAHAIGIIHRDIKPENLFLCQGSATIRTLKVLDFGVARIVPEALLLAPHPPTTLTDPGMVVGTPRYVSPEGALARQVDHRADLYSAILVLYAAVAGRGPFDHIRSPLMVLSAHAAEDPEPPSRFCKDVPAALDRVILRALQKRPDERFQTADALREELERIIGVLQCSPDCVATSTFGIAALGTASDLHPSEPKSVTSLEHCVQTRQQRSMPARADEGPLQIGTRFLDKYEIRSEIGRGGQASIYLGQHIFTAREVAIKIIHSPRGVTREMLVRGKSEARALGKLDHPSIVVMHDAGVTDDGLFYIVMELLRGHSLREVLAAHGRLGIEELLRLAIQAGEAVQAAHEVQMVHRDLKPDNIYVTKGNRLKVLDFGIAKMLNEIGFTTRKDIVIGSLLYMSPEQVLGLPITAQSDICALGLMMFEALIGKHPSLLVFERDLSAKKMPYRHATVAEIPAIQVNRMPPLLSELDSDIPNHVAEVVQRAIAKAAKDRFSTMCDFVSALRVCLELVCREQPSRSSTVGERDLSQGIHEALETPSSQRATPKQGILWDGARSLATSTLPVVRATASRRISIAEAIAPVRNAMIGGCLFGASLGTVGAFMYFGTPSRAALQVPQLASKPVRAPLADLEPESVARVEIASVLPSPAPPVPATLGATPTAHRGPKPARTSAAAPSVDKLAESTVQSGLGSEPSQSTAPSRPSQAHTKRINGGRLIYGD